MNPPWDCYFTFDKALNKNIYKIFKLPDLYRLTIIFIHYILKNYMFSK